MKEFTERINLSLVEGTMERIAGVQLPGESRLDMIREAIENLIQRRNDPAQGDAEEIIRWLRSDQVERLLFPGESRLDLVREAIEREIQRRNDPANLVAEEIRKWVQPKNKD